MLIFLYVILFLLAGGNMCAMLRKTAKSDPKSQLEEWRKKSPWDFRRDMKIKGVKEKGSSLFHISLSYIYFLKVVLNHSQYSKYYN